MNQDQQPSTENQTQPKIRWSFLAFIVAYTVAVKVLPYVLYRWGMDVEENFAIYPWNFTPMFAVCLFGGAFSRMKAHALWLPVVMMLLGDLGIWAVTGKFDWAFYPNLPVVYAAMVLCVLIGFALRKRQSWGMVAGAGLASCVTFFLITNFGSWLGSTTYPQTFDGLMTCYAAGLPFLKNSLNSTAIFTGILFSPACVTQNSLAMEQKLQPAASGV